MEQGIANGQIRIGQRIERRRRIDNAGTGGKLGGDEFLAVGDQPGLRLAAERDDQIAAGLDFVGELSLLYFFELSLRPRHQDSPAVLVSEGEGTNLPALN